RSGDGNAGVAAAENHHVEFLDAHRTAFAGVGYFDVMAEVIEPTTLVAIANCAARSVMLWRRAIHSKSVHTAHTSPLSSWVNSRRTGQSSPALGFDVMNCVPSGGLPNTRSVDGLSLMPASAASFDWSISLKNLIPLAAISAFNRVTVS